jgi:ABC-type uncharacterized transport system permease subunit
MYLLYAHIFCAFLGQVCSVFATFFSLAFLLRHNFLKKKKIKSFRYPLETIESYVFYAVMFSVILYTLSLLSGFTFMGNLSQNNLWSKILWAILVWLWYLSILLAKIYNKISRKVFSHMTIMGFFLILGSIFGTVFFH